MFVRPALASVRLTCLLAKLKKASIDPTSRSCEFASKTSQSSQHIGTEMLDSMT
jgi:hypothetical protein